MANPEEAYQVCRMIIDCLAGRIRPEPNQIIDVSHVDAEQCEGGYKFEFEGWTGTFEVIVKERNG